MSYFLQIFLARGSYETKKVETVKELHRAVRLETERRRSDSICVAVGTDTRVMPYAWVRREWIDSQDRYGPWRGGEGDGKKLGLKPQEIEEAPAPLVLDLDDAIEQGYAHEVESPTGCRTVRVLQPGDEPPATDDLSKKAHAMARKLLKDAGLE